MKRTTKNQPEQLSLDYAEAWHEVAEAVAQEDSRHAPCALDI